MLPARLFQGNVWRLVLCYRGWSEPGHFYLTKRHARAPLEKYSRHSFGHFITSHLKGTCLAVGIMLKIAALASLFGLVYSLWVNIESEGRFFRSVGRNKMKLRETQSKIQRKAIPFKHGKQTRISTCTSKGVILL